MKPKPSAEVATINADDVLKRKGDPMSAVSGSQVPAFSTALVRLVAGTVWNFANDTHEAKSTKAAAALAAVRAFEPKDEIEGMIAAQAVALHLAAMECARRAMLPDQPGEAASRLLRDTANLSRAMVDMTEVIDRRRGKGPQVVRVERVVVHEGGQAIVGTVSSDAGPEGGGTGQSQGKTP
jgi:hypothetical protein